MEHLNEIEQLIDLVSSSRIHELSAQVGERRIVITGGHKPRVRKPPSAQSSEPKAVDATALPDGAADLRNGAGNQRVIAPMVGVFHHADPPVDIGVKVKAGQIIGFIESMKLMNDIRADEAGIIASVSIEDGRAVEYGQPLFEVRPAPE